MKKVNSLSGGKSSSYMAVHYPADFELFSLVCIDDYKAAPKDKKIVQLVNDKLEKFIPEFGEFIATAENDQTLSVMLDLEQYLGREIIWIRGASFDNVIDAGTKTRLPSWARRYCTEQMKILPIFLWWFNNISEKVDMRIGFRFDEFKRMERFLNNPNATKFKIPTACKNYGNFKQMFTEFAWRYCSFPMVQDGVTNEVVKGYWKQNGVIPQTLFEEIKKIEFPVISNCEGCFHKKIETLAVSAINSPETMNWFSLQEKKGKGTFLDCKTTYEHIIMNAKHYAKEALFEMNVLGQTCDTGGCTD